MTKKQITTSVKINEELFEEFKILCIKYKFSFTKLANRTAHLYITDPEFRRLINNHTNHEYDKEK